MRKNDVCWSTISEPRRNSGKSWKRFLGLLCPHGNSIVLVDGSHVRNHHDSDFDQGGNGFRYAFVPKNEIWIDEHVPDAELAFVAFHECQEIEYMREGWSYDRAHLAAKKWEGKLRHKYWPGERHVK